MTSKMQLAEGSTVFEPTITSDELERLLKLSESTIRRLVKEHCLPAPLRLGRQRRWRASDIAMFLTGTTAVATHEKN